MTTLKEDNNMEYFLWVVVYEGTRQVFENEADARQSAFTKANNGEDKPASLFKEQFIEIVNPV